MNRKIFFTLYLILFTGSFSAGMVIPLISGYAHQMGGDAFSIGLVFGITSVSMILCHPLVGRFSDMRGRKPFIACGLAMGIFTSAGLALSNSILSLIMVRFWQGIGGAMVGPVSQAYAGEITSQGKEAFIMGSLNTSLWVGFGCGPVVGGLIKDIYGIQTAFIVRGGLCLISLLICLVFLPSDNLLKDRVKRKPTPVFRKLIFDKHLRQILLFRICLYMCIGVFWAFCPLIGELDFGMSGMDVGLVITMGTLAGTLFLPLFGKIADRTDKGLLITLGGILIAGGMVKFSFIGSVLDFYVVSIMIGLGGAMVIPSILAITVINGVKYSSMGSVVSFMTAGDNIGMTLGPMIGGALMAGFSNQIALQVIALFMVTLTTYMYFCRHELKNDDISNS